MRRPAPVKHPLACAHPDESYSTHPWDVRIEVCRQCGAPRKRELAGGPIAELALCTHPQGRDHRATRRCENPDCLAAICAKHAYERQGKQVCGRCFQMCWVPW